MMLCRGHFVLAILLVASLRLTAAPARPRAITPQGLPGGTVASPDLKIGYLPNSANGVDAVDLTSGAVLWTARNAPRPLLATSEQVYAEAPVAGSANKVRIVVLDAATGRRLKESPEIVLPAWASTSLTYGRSYGSTAAMVKDDFLLIWEARAWYAGGARPTPEMERRARKEASGVFRIDFDAGKIEAMDADKAPPGLPTIAPEPNIVKGPDKVFTLIEKLQGAGGLEWKRTLEVRDKAGEVLWQRSLRSRHRLLPLP